MKSNHADSVNFQSQQDFYAIKGADWHKGF
jgi:hypothetical protein